MQIKTQEVKRRPFSIHVVNVQNPVRLGEHNEPGPDLAVIRARDYR